MTDKNNEPSLPNVKKAISQIEASSNLLLSSISAADFALLQPHLVRLPLDPKAILISADQPIEHVFFLENGVASVVQTYPDGSEIEVGVVGREGITGASLFLYAQQSPFKVYMQVNGTSIVRISASAILNAVDQSPTLAATFLSFCQVLWTQAAHTAAVNARCAISRRLARWLLMFHDRVEGNSVCVTHDVMAIMLGVRRPGVTEALAGLEKLGAVQGHRARIEILNRTTLENFAGNAYGLAETEYRRLIGPFGKSAF